MDHCIGATPAEQTACGTAPPREHVTAADVGTLIGFDDWTSGGQNTWAADDGWFDVVLDWDFVWCKFLRTFCPARACGEFRSGVSV